MRTILITLLCSLTLAAADGPRRAPGFALPDLKGDFHDLADYRGKVLVLEFLKTDCPHCAAFSEVLSQIQPRYGDAVAVLAVAHLGTDTPQNIAQFIAGHNLTYPVALDMGQMMYSYVRSPQGANLPRVYIIDAHGYIRADYEYNAVTREVFEGKALFGDIDRLLKK
ncbi:MAG: TlpA disulfide reductase family protein [Bryobacteraceae bacterium]|jgi:peroxiredoxin